MAISEQIKIISDWGKHFRENKTDHLVENECWNAEGTVFHL